MEIEIIAILQFMFEFYTESFLVIVLYDLYTLENHVLLKIINTLMFI